MKFSFFSSFLVLFLIISFFSPLSLFAATFTRNLRQGDSGIDVYAMQKALNSNVLTQVAISGAGSPGQESQYFGSLTKKAVINFQQLYKNDILVPAGLTYGTGFVGALTRAILEHLVTAEVTSTTISAPTSGQKTNLIATTSNPVIIFNAVPHDVKPGGVISITGIGFSSKNDIYLNSVLVAQAVSTSSTQLSFNLPSSITPGKYVVRIVNDNGDSATVKKPDIVLNVTNETVMYPIIISVSPQVTAGGTVTITGTNFSPDGNVVLSPFGSSTSLTSRNGMIQFDASALAIVKSLARIPATSKVRKINIPLYVQNKEGVQSQQPANITITF